MKKTVTQTEWKEMKLIQTPTETRGAIKRDSNGNLFSWVSSGKRIEIKGVNPKSIAKELLA